MSWQCSVGGNGQVIAVLQDQFIEIRSSRDDYGTVIGRCAVSKDPFPQWRKLAWSPDCSMLACAYSNGSVDFFDLLGSNLFTISKVPLPNNSGPQDLSSAVAGMVFTDIRVRRTQWSSEFLIATYKGNLFSYFVSPTEGFQESHRFAFSNIYPKGITCLTHHPGHQLLTVSGHSKTSQHLSSLRPTASQYGITVWRILSDYPYYTIVTSLEEDMGGGRRIFTRIPFSLYGRQQENWVLRLSISPSGKHLAAVHTSGLLSVWHLPNLQLKNLWQLQDQPGHNIMNPQYHEPGKKRKGVPILSEPYKNHIVDVNWWSDHALILARCSGAITVSSVDTLQNLLGESPEWYEPFPQVMQAQDRGFLGLECECQLTSKRRVGSSQTEDVGEDTSDDEEVSAIARSAQVVKRALYFITDSERFRQRRKRPKLLTRTYRLLCLKSTTPEELFTRKIDNEEYGEALALARAYNLDCDLVYHRQWRKAPVSVASIQDYLSKITKRSWVLRECLERVPESVDAAKELLQYGLQGTHLEALIAIGKGEDHGRYIAQKVVESDIAQVGRQSGEDLEGFRILEENKRIQELLKKVDFKNLTLEQKQLCEYRLRLLMYLDRLATYEIILGGPHMAEELYDYSFFQKFRSQPALEAAINFARSSNWRAVHAMFTYHGAETLPHRLVILSSFPETTSPFEYRSLLPEAGYGSDEPDIYLWEEARTRGEDWCEINFLRPVLSPKASDFEADFYEVHREFWKYRTSSPTAGLLTQWFSERAREIERVSHLVDNALELVKLGRERKVKNLEKLHDDLVTMEMLVYECQIDRPLTFEKFEEMSNVEKLKLLMSQSVSTEAAYIKNARKWMVPFLERCARHQPGSENKLIREYLLAMAKTDLSICYWVFDNSRETDPIIPDMKLLMSLALECLYACERDDQLGCAFSILECLPQKGFGDRHGELNQLHDEVDRLENHLYVAEILEQNGMPLTLGYLRSCQDNADAVKQLLVKMTRLVSRKTPPLKEFQWKQVLADLIEMQKKLFNCISPDNCYEMYIEALLCSSRKENITLAGHMLECSPIAKLSSSTHSNAMQHSKKIPHDQAISLVLTAAREYFNSAATLSDPSMNLAKACLQLIQDPPPSIEEEMDLITSLSLLQDFSVNILPLQVRLCDNRLELVKQALQLKPQAYKNSQRLIRLGYLLRVSGNSHKECEGSVVTLVAESALEAKDYESCYQACLQLMELGYQEGWRVCHKLGQCSQFAHLQGRCQLLSFAVCYCTPDTVDLLLKAKIQLELETLYEQLRLHLDGKTKTVELNGLIPDAGKSVKESAAVPEGAAAFLQQTQQILHNTTQTTKSVLSSFGKSHFLKDTIRWFHSFRHSDDTDSSNVPSANSSFIYQGVYPFYMGPKLHPSKLFPDYSQYIGPRMNESVELPLFLLRASVVEDFLDEAHVLQLDSKVLIELAQAIIAEDTPLGLACLLPLPKAGDAQHVFAALPKTAVTLQLSTYFYSLHVASHFAAGQHDLDTLYLNKPACIIKQCLKHIEQLDPVPDGDMKDSVELLRKHSALLSDFVQGEVLHQQGGGVDVTRFVTDDVYKKETILGLAMTQQQEVLQVAVSLASRYNIPVWTVYLAHLEFLFSDTNIPLADLESQVRNVLASGVLRNDSQIQERVKHSIYPNIEGKDYPRLILYYSVLESCGDAPDALGLKPSTNLKNIKRIKSVTSTLNYKELIAPGSNPLKLLEPILNQGNIHVFAKMAQRIPNGNRDFLTSSKLFSVMAQKVFFEGVSHQRKDPQTFSDWIHRYEVCKEYMQRTLPEDFIEFINCITFSEASVSRLTLDCRLEITKRALKYCKQQITKGRDNTSDQWQEVIAELQRNTEHLQRMEDEIVSGLKSSLDESIQKFAMELDLSRSVPEKLQAMLLRAAMEGQPVMLLQTLLATCPSQISWDPAEVYMEAIKAVTEQLTNVLVTVHPTLKLKDPLVVLEEILVQIANSDELISGDTVMEMLRPFCCDVSVPVHIRLKVLQILQKTTTLSPQDMQLLKLSGIQALLVTDWPHLEVTDAHIATETARYSFLELLLQSCQSASQSATLASLFECWADLPALSVEDPATNLWVKLLSILISLPEPNAPNEVVRLFKKALTTNSLSSQCCWDIFEKMVKRGSLVHIMKVALVTECPEIHMKAMALLNEQHEDMSWNDCHDKELLSLLLCCHLSGHVVSTQLFGPLTEYLLSQQDCKPLPEYLDVERVAFDLRKAGHLPEAGSLLFLFCGTHRGLTVYSSAIGVLKRWIQGSDSK